MCLADRLAHSSHGQEDRDEFLLVAFNLALAVGITYVFSLVLHLMVWIDEVRTRQKVNLLLDIEVRVSTVSAT